MRYLIDEDLPRMLASFLRADGQDVADARDVGLRSRADEDVFAYAQADSRVLLTMDLDFADEHRFPWACTEASSSCASRRMFGRRAWSRSS